MKTLRYVLVLFFALQSNAQISDFDHIDFKKADSIALECKDEGLHNLPKLAYRLTSNLETDAERFRAIYMWVCTNIKNDYSLYSKNLRKRKRFETDTIKLQNWNDKVKKTIFSNLLKNKKTICTGYAYILKEISTLAEIKCEIINGFGRTSTINIETLNTPNHSWNAVLLNDKWYLCDPTWASGIPNPKTNRFQFSYNDGFFFPNPELFAVNHFPAQEKWTLLQRNTPSFQSFLDSPILYGKAYQNLSLHEAPNTMHTTIKKHEKVTFEYQLKKHIASENISLLIDNGFSSTKVKPTSMSINKQHLILEHQFNTIGFYDVHFYIDNDLISTYTVDVKRNNFSAKN